MGHAIACDPYQALGMRARGRQENGRDAQRDLKCYSILRHRIHKHSSCTSASMHCNARPAAAVGVADNGNMSLQGDGVGEAFPELQD